MQFFGKTNIDFVSKRNTWVIFSVSIIVIGFIFAFIFPPKFGIDFTGGSEVAVAFSENINTNDIRSAISDAGIKNAEIKSFGETNQYLIRVSELGDVQVAIQTALEKIPNNKGINIIVDYAHTDDALERVLKALRQVTKGKLFSVFGCDWQRRKIIYCI